MRYSYVGSWAVSGSLSLPEAVDQIELACSDSERFLLVRNPDELLEPVEFDLAIRITRLNMMFGGLEVGREEAVRAALDEVVAERRSKAAGRPVLVLVAGGDVDPILDPDKQSSWGEALHYEAAIDKPALSSNHRAAVEAMHLSLALEGDEQLKFDALSSGVYLTPSDGERIYSSTFSMTGLAPSVAQFVDEGLAQRIAANYSALCASPELERIERLSAQMLEAGRDNLKAYLAGWAALEILISRAFKQYENDFLAPLASGEPQVLRARFLARLKEVMGSRYRLADKFAVVYCVLFPNAADVVVAADAACFETLKQMRDRIYHGGDFDEAALPLAQLRDVLKRMLSAYVLAKATESEA